MHEHREPRKPWNQHQKPENKSSVDMVEWRDDVNSSGDEKDEVVEDRDP